MFNYIESIVNNLKRIVVFIAIIIGIQYFSQALEVNAMIDPIVQLASFDDLSQEYTVVNSETQQDILVETEFSKYSHIDTNGEIIVEFPNDYAYNLDIDYDEILTNIDNINIAVREKSVYVDQDYHIYIKEIDERFASNTFSNSFIWKLGGFDLYLDAKTSIEIGILVWAISSAVAFASLADMITKVNQFLGSQMNYVYDFLGPWGRFLGTIFYPINAIIIGSMAIQVALA